MALNYAKESRLVGFGSKDEKTEKVVSIVKRAETVTSQELVEQIHLRTLLPTQTVLTVLSGLTDSLKTYFTNGHGVHITETFGIMYPRLVKSKTEDGEKEKLSVGVGFRPSSEMKDMLEKIAVKSITETDTEEEVNSTPDDNEKPNGTTPPVGGNDDEDGGI